MITLIKSILLVLLIWGACLLLTYIILRITKKNSKQIVREEKLKRIRFFWLGDFFYALFCWLISLALYNRFLNLPWIFEYDINKTYFWLGFFGVTIGLGGFFCSIFNFLSDTFRIIFLETTVDNLAQELNNADRTGNFGFVPGFTSGLFERTFFCIAVALNLGGIVGGMITWTALKAVQVWNINNGNTLRAMNAVFNSLLSLIFATLGASLHKSSIILSFFEPILKLLLYIR